MKQMRLPLNRRRQVVKVFLVYDNGDQAIINTPAEFIEACVRTLEEMRGGQSVATQVPQNAEEACFDR